MMEISIPVTLELEDAKPAATDDRPKDDVSLVISAET
jgi:hypothetical protein